MKWIKENWMILAFVILIATLFGDRACKNANYKAGIDALDEEISSLAADNSKLEDVAFEAVRGAQVAEKIVAEKEVIIAESQLEIKALRAKREGVVEIIMALPASTLVERTREILECAEVELTEHGVLFSVECSRLSLVMIEEFSLIKEELDETRFSLSESLGALQLQKMATWKVYKIAWAQGSQILNYQTMIKKQDIKFAMSEQRGKKSWFNGLFLGLAIGAGITVTIAIVIPLIRIL